MKKSVTAFLSIVLCLHLTASGQIQRIEPVDRVVSQGDTLTRFRLADERKLVFLLNQRALYKAEVDSLLLLDSLNTVQKSMCDSTVLLSLRRSSLLQKEANLQMQRSNMWEAEASRQKKKRVVFQAISAILAVTIVAIEIF